MGEATRGALGRGWIDGDTGPLVTEQDMRDLAKKISRIGRKPKEGQMPPVYSSLSNAIKNMTDDPLRWPLWRRLGLFKAGVYKPGGPFRPYAAEVFPPDSVARRMKRPWWAKEAG